MEESSNLNWAVYHGGTGTYDEESGERINVALWAKIISKYVLYYPAVDGISTFVLCAVSLEEIIKGAWYGSAVHDLNHTWKERWIFRLLGFVPQLIGAAFVRDITGIATYAGLFTIASYTICPSLLQIFSTRLMVQMGLPTKTQYSTVFSSERVAWTVVLFGIVLIFYAMIGLAIQV
eukprot:scaffold4410_cov44-Attheya_sp.AAC.8